MNNFYLDKEAREIGARLLLQVHDELIVEAPIEHAERAKEILVDKMENAYKLVVPLIAEAHIGDNWEAAKG
jgi:DNA polymerase-1